MYYKTVRTVFGANHTMEAAPNENDGQPNKTDVVIPGENVVIDHWVVSSGSAVRAKDIIAYVRKREGNVNDTAPPVAAAPKHKRPTRRKKTKVARADALGSQSSNATGTSSSAPKSTTMSLKDLLAAKKNNKTEPSSIAPKEPENKTSEPVAPTQETKSASATPSTVASKTKQLMPIHAPSSGILRIHNNLSNLKEKRLVIGVIEECLHPAFVDGMCVVCGTPQASLKDDKNKSKTTISERSNSAPKTVKVTVTGGVTMTVSKRESESMAMLDADRLFKQKRLSLVLDLDHTLVHATADPRAHAFLNPNHPRAVATGDLRTISLSISEGAGPKADPRHKHIRSYHYIKMRPYVKEFLDTVRKTYEVSVYTAGTRQYAEEIAMVLSRKLAGAVIDSDELERLRQRVRIAEREYERNLNEDKKRAAEAGETNSEEQPPRKKKKVSFGFSEAADDDNSRNHDRITKEKLEDLQAELLTAEALESKAKSIRQSLFGSRIISRTDVGDLGRDVKSLKRVFPCGGTMAAVVDDREDVWANAKDNSKGTIKGEPPDNLLLVRPYHWQPFVGFADVNNAAGADLSGSGPAKEDKQLLWTKNILVRLHKRYYEQSSKGNRLTVPETLKQMRQEVLMGSNMVLSGLVPLHKQSGNGAVARPHFVRYAQNLGAKTQDRVDFRVSHVVAAKDGTDKALAARKIPGCMLVKSAWLMECFWSMERRDATPFLMAKVTPQNVLRESNASEGSTNDSDDDDDDDFAAEFESELMDMS